MHGQIIKTKTKFCKRGGVAPELPNYNQDVEAAIFKSHPLPPRDDVIFAQNFFI